MSTKIFNGYRLRMPVAAAHATVQAWKPAARELLFEHYRLALTTRAVDILDHRALGLEDPGDVPGGALIAAARDVHRRRRQTMEHAARRDPEYDFEAEVVLLPLSGRTTLALLYTEWRDVRDLWEQSPGVEPYPFWDSADRPETVSPQAWATRRRAWDLALGDRPPAVAGWCTQVVGRYGLPHVPPSDVVARAAPVQARARDHARGQLVFERMQREGVGEASFSTITQFYQELRGADIDARASEVARDLPAVTERALAARPRSRRGRDRRATGTDERTSDERVSSQVPTTDRERRIGFAWYARRPGTSRRRPRLEMFLEDGRGGLADVVLQCVEDVSDDAWDVIHEVAPSLLVQHLRD